MISFKSNEKPPTGDGEVEMIRDVETELLTESEELFVPTQAVPFALPNTASVSYLSDGERSSAVSDTQAVTVAPPISLKILSLSHRYRANSQPTFILSVENLSGKPLESLALVFDLGTFTQGDATAVPLGYEPGAVLFVDGEYKDRLDTRDESQRTVHFVVEDFDAGSRAQVCFQAAVNKKAPLAAGSSITVNAEACSGETCVKDSLTLFAEDFARLSITKSVSKGVAVEGERLTWLFELRNSGNIPATDVVFKNSFDPAMEIESVYVDQSTIDETQYSYENGLLTVPHIDTELPLAVPAAEFETDPETGVVVTTPGVVRVRVVVRA